MNRKIAVLDVCGHGVGLWLTDEAEKLGNGENAGSDEEKLSFGKYSVDECRIWLDVRMCPSMLRSHLFHEVYEWTLGYYNVNYDPGKEHEAFLRFSNVLWEVLLRNRKILFGTKFVDLLCAVRESEGQRNAKETQLLHVMGATEEHKEKEAEAEGELHGSKVDA